MWTSRRNSSLFILVLLTIILGVDSSAQLIPPECRYKERDRNGKEHRYEGVKNGYAVAGEHLQFLSAAANYQDPLLLCVSDLKDPASLAARLRDAGDALSRHLQQQFSPDTRGLLSGYDSSTLPSESLQKALVRELNQLLAQALYDQTRFAGVALSTKTQNLIEQSPQGKRLIHLNRLLLEDAYPDEIAKSQYLQENLLYPVGKLNVGFYSDIDESEVDVTVTEYDIVYYMETVNKEYKAGFNSFSWDDSIIKTLKLSLSDLRITVKTKKRGRVIVKPAILYDVSLPGMLKLESYDFVFMPDVDCDVNYTILRNGEVKSQGFYKERQTRHEVPITWGCEDAEEGWYQLVVEFHFQSPEGRSRTIYLPPHEFYHKPELEIP